MKTNRFVFLLMAAMLFGIFQPQPVEAQTTCESWTSPWTTFDPYECINFTHDMGIRPLLMNVWQAPNMALMRAAPPTDFATVFIVSPDSYSGWINDTTLHFCSQSDSQVTLQIHLSP